MFVVRFFAACLHLMLDRAKVQTSSQALGSAGRTRLLGFRSLSVYPLSAPAFLQIPTLSFELSGVRRLDSLRGEFSNELNNEERGPTA
jgi:hypothetical protein